VIDLQGPLTPLPPQPDGVPWPVPEWAESDPPATVELGPLLDQAFDPEGPLARTFAVVIIHRGRLVAERYADELEHFDRPPDPVGPDSKLISWSMAKSMLHATIGILVGEGRLSLDGPAPVPEWASPDDSRHAISLQDLLEMRDGLQFVEDYVDDTASDVIGMLFGAGASDVVAYAAARPLAAAPGEQFSYSSGTSNVVSGIARRAVAPEPIDQWLRQRLFGPIGMASAEPGLDAAGNWVASSYVHATARDYARFGLLYLRDGVWDGERILPEGWVDHGRTPRSVDPTEGSLYGAHWWVVGGDHGTFRAAGYEGQSIVIVPALDLVVVRLGKTPEERSDALRLWREDVVAAFARTA
jgi:CubicO group peptidase (beta-lactamase class C family)